MPYSFSQIVEIVQSHIRRSDITRADISRAYYQFLLSLPSKGYFGDLDITTKLSLDNNYAAPLPSDFYDDIAVFVTRKDASTSIKLLPFMTEADFLLMTGTRNLTYINSTYAPTLPSFYLIAKPADVFTDIGSIIPETIQTQKCVIVYPPIDTNIYELNLQYISDGGIKSINPLEIPDNYTHPIADRYPDWVIYSLCYIVSLQIRDFEGAAFFKQLMDEEWLKVKAAEAERKMSPWWQIGMKQFVTPLVRPAPGPRHPQ